MRYEQIIIKQKVIRLVSCLEVVVLFLHGLSGEEDDIKMDEREEGGGKNQLWMEKMKRYLK